MLDEIEICFFASAFWQNIQWLFEVFDWLILVSKQIIEKSILKFSFLCAFLMKTFSRSATKPAGECSALEFVSFN